MLLNFHPHTEWYTGSLICDLTCIWMLNENERCESETALKIWLKCPYNLAAQCSLAGCIASLGNIVTPGQSETAPTLTRPQHWMDAAWTGHFFSLGSCPPANLPIAAEGSKRCARGSKVGVHPTGWPENWKMEWSVCACWAESPHTKCKSLIFTGEFSPKREIKIEKLKMK